MAEETTTGEAVAAPNPGEGLEIVEGTVCGITNFGAFVKLADGKEGLVHISEISPSFVKNVGDFLKIGQVLQVKILGINKRGKLDLSIKQINPTFAPLKPEEKEQQRLARKDKNPEDYYPRFKPAPMLSSLEDKLGFFMKRSDEKLLDIKKNTMAKQGAKKKTGKFKLTKNG
ncbi:MAG: S1 RNA-binding domain-containing protein [Candidatus Margulisiibacteriota bacterium]|jgi:S1 RNA binding domain protein